MMRFADRHALRCFCLVALCWGLLLSVESLPGQNAPPRIGSVPELLNIERDWDKDAKEEAKDFELLRKGDEPVTEDAKKILDDAAKWYAYRLTDPRYQEPTGGKSMHELVKQALAQLLPKDEKKPLNANQQVFMEEFGRRLTARLEEVSKNRKEIARVNAAMILAELAGTGVEEAADVLVDIIQDPNENDGVRFFAFHGLKKLFSFERAEDQNPLKKKDRGARRISALLEYLDRKPALRPGATPQEVAAVNYVRCEAVAALGQTRLPASTRTVGKKTHIERPTALALLKVMRKDGVPIQPSVREQVNACVSLCQLKSRLCDEYQPDYAVYHIGFFLAEFTNRYNADETINVEKKNKAGEKLEPKQVSREPWKIEAVRLHQALDELKADTERYAEAKYIASLVSQAQTLLVEIINGRKGVDPRNLETYLQQNPPKSATLYKDVVTAKITSETEKTGE